MTPERWKRVKEVAQAVLECTEENKTAVLEGACGDDKELLHEVLSILEADQKEIAFLDRPLLSLREEKPAPLTEGVRIGAYRVIRRLGRGGMGVVYLATRADDVYEQRVAVKILNYGTDSEEGLHRFRAERQILADLNHPHIARLHDGGTTPDGLPYFVMEYVDGIPIDRYCDRQHLSVSARIALFRKICSAVHFAHQNLIVHRDLKPENILVTKDGLPKLLDFGIAKFLEPDRSLTVTRIGRRLMTPKFASPEQVRGETITTASDVYSLGVLLYRLLSGYPPYRFHDSGEEAIKNVICTEIPSPPSEVMATEKGAATGEAHELDPKEASLRRGTEPRRLRRVLAGDLDTIILMALRKEPERRYQSVQAFSDDLERYLNGFPVHARKETLGYLVTRFIRRYRLLAATITFAFLLTIGSSLTFFLQQKQTERERDRTARITQFLTDFFESSDPYRKDKEEVTARDLLDRAAEEIDDLEEEPEIQASLLKLFGKVYNNLGFFDQARTLFERAVHIDEERLGTGHPELVGALINQAQAIIKQGFYLEAEAPAQRALAILERTTTRPNPLLAETFHMLGLTSTARGDFTAAGAFFQKALRDSEKLYGKDHMELANLHNNMAGSFNIQGRFAEAETAIRRCLAIQEKGLEPDHPFLAISLMTLARSCFHQGKLDEALPFARRSVAIAELKLGEKHLNMALALGNLGRVLVARAELAEAESVLERALSVYQANGKPDHPECAMVRNKLNEIHLLNGRFLEAETQLAILIERQQKLLGDDHPYLAVFLVNLGRARLLQDKLPEAEKAYRRALTIRRGAFGPTHPLVAESLFHLGAFYHAWGKDQEAVSFCREAYQVLEALPEERHPYGYPNPCPDLLKDETETPNKGSPQREGPPRQ